MKNQHAYAAVVMFGCPVRVLYKKNGTQTKLYSDKCNLLHFLSEVFTK